MPDVVKSYLWVALGSALGGVSRFWLSQTIADRIGGAFPWGTIIVNISGSFVIGFFAACSAAEGRLSASARIFTVQFLMLGVCGGYTTFSSFSLQTLNLAREGEWLHAGGNVLVSVIVCLIAVWLGYILGQLISRSL
jgi:CrcB protein